MLNTNVLGEFIKKIYLNVIFQLYLNINGAYLYLQFPGFCRQMALQVHAVPSVGQMANI